MDVVQAIRERRTVGTFSTRAAPRALIASLIAGAVWAPNHRTTEPWRFHVLAGAAREALALAIEAGAIEAGAAGAESEEAAGVARTARSKLLRSPAVVVISQVVAEDADAVRDLEDYAACCCATQNLLLAAHAAGLASKWSTGALARSPAAKAHLGLEPRDRIVGYIYLGYGTGDGTGDRTEAAERSAPRIDWRGL